MTSGRKLGNKGPTPRGGCGQPVGCEFAPVYADGDTASPRLRQLVVTRARWEHLPRRRMSAMRTLFGGREVMATGPAPSRGSRNPKEVPRDAKTSRPRHSGSATLRWHLRVIATPPAAKTPSRQFRHRRLLRVPYVSRYVTASRHGALAINSMMCGLGRERGLPAGCSAMN